MMIEKDTPDNPINTIVIGDQNAQPLSMTAHYPPHEFDILSATDSESELIHAAMTKGLNPQPIDLGPAGEAFKDKGKPGCSDHRPMAFTVTLPVRM